MTITLREGRPEDAGEAGRICYEAFHAIATAHGFPPDFPSAEVGMAVVGGMLGAPGLYSVVAEVDGKIAGSNFLMELNPISGVGPITVDPTIQNRGLGGRLMEAVMERSAAKGFACSVARGFVIGLDCSVTTGFACSRGFCVTGCWLTGC